MPLLTFTPSIAPTPGTRHKPQVSLFQADFGDGYSQAAPAGLNHIRRTVELMWEGLTLAQFNELEDFFAGRGGYLPFWYQPRWMSAPAKWTCKEWSGTDGSPWTFSAKLVEDFSADV